MVKIMNNRFLMIAAVLAAGLGATAVTVSAQPRGLGRCGGYLAPPLPTGRPCRWVCDREQLGTGNKSRPAPQRMVWKKVCASTPSGTDGKGADSYGHAEVKKKNVPTVKPNKPAGPND
ncbi:MAG: hypothetical protein HY765_06280 [Rhodomicrobium sp.]|nr:hypothetical protein [Rhodomicrobium sp.]